MGEGAHVNAINTVEASSDDEEEEPYVFEEHYEL